MFQNFLTNVQWRLLIKLLVQTTLRQPICTKVWILGKQDIDGQPIERGNISLQLSGQTEAQMCEWLKNV